MRLIVFFLAFLVGASIASPANDGESEELIGRHVIMNPFRSVIGVSDGQHLTGF